MADEPETDASAPNAPVVADAPPEPIAEAAQAVEEVPDRIDTAIRAWVSEHIHNSPVSRDTDAFNHLVSVLPHLAAKLKEA